MADFYSAWLANSERIEKAVGEAPRVARGKELNWIRTRQDHKAALMIAPEISPTPAGFTAESRCCAVIATERSNSAAN